jgi:hypothetical protein
MSNQVYPVLPGLKFDVKKLPQFASLYQESVTGKDNVIALRAYPIYNFDLQYEAVRDTAAYPEFDSLFGFFLARQGRFDSWLFNDPDDNSVTQQLIGVGDGTNTTFQLLRTLGGFTEPVYWVNTLTGVYSSAFAGPAQMNLLLQAAAFDNASWSKANTTVLADATTDPMATSTADKLRETAVTNQFSTSQQIGAGVAVSPGSVNTFSVFLKSAERTAAYVTMQNPGYTSGVGVHINLSNGTISAPVVTGTAGGAAVAVTSFGSGWYRVSVTCSVDGAATQPVCAVYIEQSYGSISAYAGTAGNGIYLFGAMFERGAIPSTGYLGTVAAVYNWSVSSSGLVTFTAQPPPNLTQVTWTGTYYFRCRFMEDALEFNKFARDLWDLSKVAFKGCLGNKIT